MKFVTILLTLLALVVSNVVLAEKRVALVIGNANYFAASRLPNDIADAKDMTAILQKYGFKVITRTDADLSGMLAALDDFGHELESGGVGLFYYSGHGLEVDGQQYIVPVDASITSKTELPYRMLNLSTVLKKIGESKTQLNLVILDACRNNPFDVALDDKGLSNGFSPSQIASNGTLIVSSTATGDAAVSAEADRNSVYTSQLLRILRTKPSDEIRLLLGDVSDAVKKVTGNSQKPWISGSMTGRFYFAQNDSGVGLAATENRDGQKTVTYTNGDKYIGMFKNNKFNGRGMYIRANGNVYVGEFKNNTLNGLGTYTFADGRKYVGEFKNNKFNGQGTYTFASGNKYVGEFRDGNYNGQGVFTYANGNKYIGEFKDDKFDGPGILIDTDGGKYIGDFKEGSKLN